MQLKGNYPEIPDSSGGETERLDAGGEPEDQVQRRDENGERADRVESGMPLV